MEIIILLGVGMYAVLCYTMYRIGIKFGVGSFGEYCIPIYNMTLICKCVNISPAYGIGLYVFNFLAYFNPVLGLGVTWCGIVIWGKIAEGLGKNFWLFGLTSFFAIPIFIMAFDGSQPIRYYQKNNMDHQGFQGQIAGNKGLKPMKLYCTVGEYAANEIAIPLSGLVIGRDSSQANLVVTSADISRTHVRIMPDTNSDGIIVEDLNSTNGTFYQSPGVVPNGLQWTRVRGSVRIPRNGRIRLGNSVLEFEVI